MITGRPNQQCGIINGISVAVTLLALALITAEAVQSQLVNKQTTNVRTDSLIISGTVKDAHNKPLENVAITFDKYKTMSDTNGYFQLALSPNFTKPGVIQFSYGKLERQARSYHPMMGSTSYMVNFPEVYFPASYKEGIRDPYPTVPDSLRRLSFQWNKLDSNTSSFLAKLATWIKDNPNLHVIVMSYYKTSKQKADKLRNQIIHYFLSEEVINPERFEFTKPKVQKNIRSEVVVEFRPAYE